MSYATLDDLRTALRTPIGGSPEWAARMLHAVPDLPTVKDRIAYLVAKATGRRVLDIGCTGPLAEALKAAAHTYYGVDRAPGPWAVVDVDVAPEQIPVYPDVDLIVVAELLEHLANPGWFLCALKDKYPDRAVYLTVPQAGAYQVKDGTHEIVNADHVAWYSYTTLHTLLARCGYTVELARWYNGQPHSAEGLIVVART